MKRHALVLLLWSFYTVLLGTSLWFWHPSLIASAAFLIFLSQRHFLQKWSFVSLLVFGLISARFWQVSPVLSSLFGGGGALVSLPLYWIRNEKIQSVLVFLRELLWFCFALSCIVFVFPEYIAGAESWMLLGLSFASMSVLCAQGWIFEWNWQLIAQLIVLGANLLLVSFFDTTDALLYMGLFASSLLAFFSLEAFFLRKSVFGPFLFHLFLFKRGKLDDLNSSGIDIRGLWALELFRRGAEPSVYLLLIFAWLSTSIHQVNLVEVGVRETLGTPEKKLLAPGAQLSLPWPLGTVQRVPVHRVYTIPIGHEDSEDEDAEEEEEDSILWADQHAEEEFVLLLGEGKSLLAADGLLSYQISDPHRYLYTVDHPEAQLRHFAYRALMQETVHRELEATLSENALLLAQRVSQRIEDELEQANIGLKLLHFSFSALHPPVEVADAYQAVVSAQIEQKSMLINAKSSSIRQLSQAQTQAAVRLRKEQGRSAKKLSEAKAESASFKGLYEAVQSSQDLYQFRIRQEALQRNLKGRELILIDHRFEEEGGALWIEP